MPSEEVAIGDRSYTKGRSRSGDRSYSNAIGGRGRDSERSPLGEGRSRSGEGRDQEIAPTGEVLGERGRHRHWEKRLLSGEGRDQEIAPTGEVLGERGRHQESRHWEKGRSRSGDRSYSIFRQLRIKKTKRWSFPHRFVG